MPRRFPAFSRYILLVTAILVLAPAPPARAAYGDITLVSQTPLSGSTRICDVWGWMDWRTGKEYAVVGNWHTPRRVWIIDVTNPALPVEVGSIDGASGFDLKVWQNYIYTCDSNGSGNDSRIIDIANPSSPVLLEQSFRSAHNIAISQSGYLFQQVTGFSLWDLNADPTVPDSLWHSGLPNGHDATPKGDHLVWDFAGWDGFARLWDYSDPSNPTIVTTVSDPAIRYYHSGDATGDGNYVYVCDELAVHPDPDIWVFDVSNPASPSVVANIADPGAIVHNLYIIDGLAFASYYSAGFKTIDVRNPANPVVADSYDTHVSTGENYDGAFGVYPFSPNGLVFVSDWDNGLFIFRVEGFNGTPTAVRSTPSPSATLHQNYPNPFNPTTTIVYEIATAGVVRLSIFDVRGRTVRRLVEGYETPGARDVVWDGKDNAGVAVASGIYYYQLSVGPTTTTKRMVLLK